MNFYKVHTFHYFIGTWFIRTSAEILPKLKNIVRTFLVALASFRLKRIEKGYVLKNYKLNQTLRTTSNLIRVFFM